MAEKYRMTNFLSGKWPNVVGYGHGYKSIAGEATLQRATVIMVSSKLPMILLGSQALPRVDDLAGLPTDVIEVGLIRAQRTGVYRPAPGGVSIGHYQITAGTLGMVVDGMILSNNHVLANSNAGGMGDPIYQPGPYDGGTAQSKIAELNRWVPISFEGGCLPIGQGPNVVDAALAEPLMDGYVREEILEIGVLTGTKEASLAQEVRKSGRTTGLTHGWIIVLDATVTVNYGSPGNAVFEHQIVSGPMSQGGDSGSILVDENQLLAVGLLFAGSDQVTIYNPISEVFDRLGVAI